MRVCLSERTINQTMEYCKTLNVLILNLGRYIKRSYKDLSCRFCQSGEEETQEFLEVRVGCDFETRGLKISVRRTSSEEREG